MTCEPVREWLAAAPPTSPWESTPAVRDHMAVCRACREFGDSLGRLNAACALWEEAQSTPTFMARFYARLEAEPVTPMARSRTGRPPGPSTLWGRRHLATAAMFLMALAASLWLSRTLEVPKAQEGTTFEEFLAYEETDLERLRDFDVIARLELLDYFDEVKAQLDRSPASPARAN